AIDQLVSDATAEEPSRTKQENPRHGSDRNRWHTDAWMTGQHAAGVGLGLLAVLLGAGGVAAAIRTRRRRAEIAATYGSTGGIVYTAVQAGCSGVLMIGGLGLIALVLLTR
ncbi:MAG: hypothetical protein QOI23_2264, partial [Chloroflexota bacterium]|nr:hypothetical protein [Chloroflexota bacterium]